jgi:hypothetical protein
VKILQEHANGWYFGESQMKTGLFPSNLVRKVTQASYQKNFAHLNSTTPHQPAIEAPPPIPSRASKPTSVPSPTPVSMNNSAQFYSPHPQTATNSFMGNPSANTPYNPPNMMPVSQTNINLPIVPTNLPPAPTVTSARVNYPFQASSAQEINLQQGEIILVLRKHDTGWWYGRNSAGAQGAFPGSFVTEINQQPTPPVSHQAPPSPQPIQTAPKQPVQRMFALQSFSASKPEELSIPSGAAVNVHHQHSPEHYFGEFNGRTGIFPCWVFQQTAPPPETPVQETHSAPDISSKPSEPLPTPVDSQTSSNSLVSICKD